MIVLPDTKTFDSSIRLVQLVGGVTKVNMLKVCDKLDLYVSPNLKKDETAHRVAQELLNSPIEILSNLNKQEVQIIDEFVKGGANTYVVRKMRKTQYKLQKLYLVATYCDEEKQEWHMLMPDELREALSSNYKFYLDLAEKGQKSFLTDRKAKKLDLLLKQQQVQKHDEEMTECKKADIEVNVVGMPRGSNNKLKFYNRGKAIAYNVKFKITSDTEDNIQLFMDKNYLPFPKLLPQQCFDIVYVQFSHEPHHTIMMTWDDDFGKGRSKEMIVDM